MFTLAKKTFQLLKQRGSKKTFQKIVLHTTFRTMQFAERILPKNRFGDLVYSTLHFVQHHGRLPSRALIFNDVLFRIKTSDEIVDPLRVFVSDKEFLKIYVKAVIGDRYNVPTFDVIRNVQAVESYEFPSACCIKPTHLSGDYIIRRVGEPVDRPHIESWFGLNYYRAGREANYKTLVPKVIVERLTFDRPNVDDFKFFCYNGVPKLIMVDIGRTVDHRRILFDVDWNELEFTIRYKKSNKTIPRPDSLPVMLDVAAKLSAAFSFVRIDLYTDGRRVLVGEITHCSGNAGENWFDPPDSEYEASKLIFG